MVGREAVFLANKTAIFHVECFFRRNYRIQGHSGPAYAKYA